MPAYPSSKATNSSAATRERFRASAERLMTKAPSAATRGRPNAMVVSTVAPVMRATANAGWICTRTTGIVEANASNKINSRLPDR